MIPIYIGIAAYSRTPPQVAVEKMLKFVEALRSLCTEEVVFVVGGYEGFMRMFVDKALEEGFRVVILPPVEQEDTVFPGKAIVVKTGATFVIRSSILVRTSDVVVAIGGGVGTLQEVVTAHNEGKPVYVLVDTGLPTDIVKSLPSRLDTRAPRELKVYSDPEALAREVCRSALQMKTQSGGTLIPLDPSTANKTGL